LLFELGQAEDASPPLPPSLTKGQQKNPITATKAVIIVEIVV